LLVGSLTQKDEFLLGFSLVFVFGALFPISGFNVNMCLGPSCAELNHLIIYRPCSNGASVPVVNYLSMPCLSLFWLLLLGFS